MHDASAGTLPESVADSAARRSGRHCGDHRRHPGRSRRTGRPGRHSAPRVSEVVAFIDLGTNSVRLLLVRILTDHAVETITEQKEMVRLGENEFQDKTLQPAAMERAIAVCREFADLARFHDARTVVAVATSATREAANKEEFLQRMADEAGLEMRVISGREEARLTYLGVASGVRLGEHQALFIDIGGGSTEIIRGDQHDYTFLDSLSLGAIRLTNEFFAPEELEAPVTEARWKELRRHVRHAVSHTAYRLRGLPVEMAFGSSGTIVNLAVIAARTAAVPPPTEDVLRLDDLRRVARVLRSLPLDERRQVPGINPPRADIIVAGAAIILTLMEELGLEQLADLTPARPARGAARGLPATHRSGSDRAGHERASAQRPATRPRLPRRRGARPHRRRHSRCNSSTRPASRACTRSAPRSASCWSTRRCCTTSARSSRTGATTGTATTSSPTPTYWASTNARSPRWPPSPCSTARRSPARSSRSSPSWGRRPGPGCCCSACSCA